MNDERAYFLFIVFDRVLGVSLADVEECTY